MIEWSDTEVMIRDAVRAFVDAEIRPHADALDSGEMLPYPIIRKFVSAFGIDTMAIENFNAAIEKEQARRGGRRPGGGSRGH